MVFAARTRARRYGVAAAAVLSATVMSLTLRPFVHTAQSPLFVAAVLLSAWFGGIGPALLATFLAVVPLDLVMAPNPVSFGFNEEVAGRLAVFVLVALFVGALASARRRAEGERLVLLGRERDARMDAEAANRAKDQFVAMVAHELRTPLTAILSWAGALADGRVDAADRMRAVAAIRRNALLQARIIGDLIDLAKVARGNVSLDVQSVDLKAVIDAAVEVNTDSARARGVKLAVDVMPACPPVVGDAVRLQQVVSNLLTNAIKHSERGSTVSVMLDTVDAQVRIQVGDEGCGIAPELLPHVFEPYRQAAGDMSRSGMGLGLTIVRQLVELHGGHVEATSPGVGHGACFSVLIPTSHTGVGVAPEEQELVFQKFRELGRSSLCPGSVGPL